MSNPLLAVEALLKFSSPETVLTLSWVSSAGGFYWTCKLADGRELSGVHGTLRGLFDHLALELKYPYLTMF